MQKKVVLLLLIIVGILAVLGFSMTYAKYKTEMANQEINWQVAKFVFEDNYTNEINLTLNDIAPGQELTTEFQVINNKTVSGSNVRSEVVVEYTITIESQFNLPIELRLYKGSETTPTLTCTKTSATLSSGVYKCQTEKEELGYTSNVTNSYKIKIKFPATDSGGNIWSSAYSGQSDYLKLYLNASQKM